MPFCTTVQRADRHNRRKTPIGGWNIQDLQEALARSGVPRAILVNRLTVMLPGNYTDKEVRKMFPKTRLRSITRHEEDSIIMPLREPIRQAAEAKIELQFGKEVSERILTYADHFIHLHEG